MTDNHETQSPDRQSAPVNENGVVMRYLPVVTFIVSIAISFGSSYAWVQVSIARFEIELKTAQVQIFELKNIQDKYVRKEDLDNRWSDIKSDLREIKGDIKELRGDRIVRQHKKETYEY